MKFEETKVGRALVVAPVGRLDSVSTPTFEAALHERTGAADTAIVLDLTAVPYVSSAALRLFLSTSRLVGETGGRLVFCGLTENVRQVFAISGFDTIFEIHADRNAALAALG
jgi:anti-anti-sigma factor